MWSDNFLKILRELGIEEIYVEREEGREELLRELYNSFKDCKACPLHKNRTQVVFGDGNPYSEVVFVGEAPGEEEDKQGKPFVGRAGKLLNEALKEAGFKREEVFITNVCKCRPPGNRKPNRVEILTCIKYLNKELEVIKPKFICCLGSTAVEGVLGRSYSITKVRGKVLKRKEQRVFITYHPSYVLRNPREYETFLTDLKTLKRML